MRTERSFNSNYQHIWQGVLPVVVYYTIMMATSFLLAGLALSQVLGGDASASNSLLASDFVMWVQAAMSAVCLVIFLLLFRRRRRTAPRYEARIVRPATVIPVVLGSVALWFIVSIVVTPLVPLFPSYEAVSEMMTDYGLLVTVLSAGVLAPLVEELCFRGLLWNGLRRAMPLWPSILLQAVIFGVFHMNPLQAIYAGIIGICFCWIYARQPSIVLPILSHMAFNMTNYMLPLFSDVSMLTAGVVSAAILLACVLFFRRLPAPREQIEPGFYCTALGPRK